jgi:hypothetical protein
MIREFRQLHLHEEVRVSYLKTRLGPETIVLREGLPILVRGLFLLEAEEAR